MNVEKGNSDLEVQIHIIQDNIKMINQKLIKEAELNKFYNDKFGEEKEIIAEKKKYLSILTIESNDFLVQINRFFSNFYNTLRVVNSKHQNIFDLINSFLKETNEPKFLVEFSIQLLIHRKEELNGNYIQEEKDPIIDELKMIKRDIHDKILDSKITKQIESYKNQIEFSKIQFKGQSLVAVANEMKQKKQKVFS